MKTIKEILELNQRHNLWKAEMNELLKSEQERIEKTNSEISIEEFLSLPYAEAKDTFNQLQYNLDYGTQRQQLGKLLEEIKLREYPMLTKAHYYPVINEMDFLNDRQKQAIDKMLKEFTNRSLPMHYSGKKDIGINKELEDKIFDFLCDKGIIERTYKIGCTCDELEWGCDCKYITQEQYNKFIKYYSMTEEQIANLTDEEYEDRENR